MCTSVSCSCEERPCSTTDEQMCFGSFSLKTINEQCCGGPVPLDSFILSSESQYGRIRQNGDCHASARSLKNKQPLPSKLLTIVIDMSCPHSRSKA